MSYKHINEYEREIIAVEKAKGKSNREIAKSIGRDRRSVDRELKRNAPYLTEYLPVTAHVKATNRARKQRRKATLKNTQVFLYVREKLRDEKWSPETIAGRLPIDIPGETICHETIYRHIYKHREDELWKCLRCQRKRRMKKGGRGVKRPGKIPGAVSIELRPEGIEERRVPGHWETDNLEGPKSSKEALSVTVERQLRHTLISRVKDQTAREKADAVVGRLLEMPIRLRGSITADNGKENSLHEEISCRLGMPMYFCHAYHSWEKGSVENMIGRIRQYIPKGTDISTISDEEISIIEQKLNNTPRKCLGYLTPNEMMEKTLT
jgi:IS30 family transposase